MSDDLVLRDLGERRIVQEVLPEFVEDAGDDCAAVAVEQGTWAVTTDPVPQPAARILGSDDDPYWMGWLLCTINASDLAAAGAEPRVFLASIEAPADMKLLAFKRLLAGIRDSCRAHGLRYVGGNLREAPQVGGHAVAIGACATGKPLGRRGAEAGDFVVSIGQGGVFWRDALRLRHGGVIGDKMQSPVFAPRARCAAMAALRSAGLVRAAIDNSDGLLPSLVQLAARNALGIVVDLNGLQVPDAGTIADAERLWLGWGDWNVLAAVGPDALPSVRKVCDDLGERAVTIGRFVAADGGVVLSRGGRTLPCPRLESERFSKDSWFSAGVGSYLAALLSVALP